ncbi:HEPN domain-containing protein [Romeria aff. gracilis LEGE 07310]|uniref:HEPN domain-containing protein n=1 Tax=Vasconcelosia minhoensis LEGE 07310 TaxID=915328 RepID=A0A8J7DQ31_9CYAN|nr:HEPN domain-containing protein [Romeria gracilis]MBE9075814.1 HEPN domain-containing protein [Romeria aff. gracilis LEGE 07310]
MDDAQLEEIQQWLIKSQRDLKVAQVLLDNKESLLDAVVYHCQQSAEKALKAYLASQNKAFMKTHDVDVLVGLCSSSEPDFQSLQEAAEILTPYATEFRYPGGLIEPERRDAEEALEMAVLVLKYVTQRLPKQ